jgi:hypothetical protein
LLSRVLSACAIGAENTAIAAMTAAADTGVARATRIAPVLHLTAHTLRAERLTAIAFCSR